MPQKTKLTSERKSKLKQEIMEELEKLDLKKVKKQKSGQNQSQNSSTGGQAAAKQKTVRAAKRQKTKNSKTAEKKQSAATAGRRTAGTAKQSTAKKQTIQKSGSVVKKSGGGLQAATPAGSGKNKKNTSAGKVRGLLERKKAFSKSVKGEPLKLKDFDDSFKPPVGPRFKAFGRRRLAVRLTAAILAVVILAGLAVAGDILAIYKLGWRDSVSRQVGEFFRLPAGTVDGRKIPLTDYWDDLEILADAINQEREGVDGLLDQSASLEQKVFDRLAILSLVDRELEAAGETISSSDLEASFQDTLVQFDSRREAEEIIKNIYRLNLDQFKKKILLPIIKKEKLRQLVVADDSLAVNRQVKEKAEKVLSLVRQSETNFGQLAEKYTDDPAGVNTGGTLGWVSRRELPDFLKQEIVSLEVGEISGLVKNSRGYHIFQLNDRLTDPDTGRESFELRQIFFEIKVNNYLSELFREAEIKRYF